MTDEKNLIRMLSTPQERRKGFEVMVRQYSEKLYWMIRRVVISHDDADDILQNTFLKAWNRLDDFRRDSRLSTWLYRIAVNESIDFLRRAKVRKALSVDEDAAAGVANQLQADPYFDGNHLQALLTEAVSQLPEVQRMVFSLRYYEEMKYSEMSELLHTSQGSLKASYHIAVGKVREYISSHERG